MTEQLPELRPLKGKQRVFKYYGEDYRGRYKTFLEDYYVVSDEAGLSREGPHHQGHRHLTFSNCVANVGDGPLFLEITRVSANRAKVDQLVKDDAVPRNRWRRKKRVGHAVRDLNPDHNHWHYADFLQYKLKSVQTRAYLGEGTKQSFCLEDVAKLRPSTRRRGFTSCPDPDERTGTMGISVGWGDVYWAGLQEQYIEVKEVPPGDYWLESVVDPRKELDVKSRRYSSTRVRVRL